MAVFDSEFQRQKKEREEARDKRTANDPYYKRALDLSKADRQELIQKANQEWSWPFNTVLTDDERQLLYRVRAVNHEEGEDMLEGAAVAAILGGLAAMAGGVVFPPGGPSPEQVAEVLVDAKNSISLSGTLQRLVQRASGIMGKEGANRLLQLIFVNGFGFSAAAAKRIAKKVTDYWYAKTPTPKQKKDGEEAVAEILFEVGKGKLPSPPKTCPEGKLLNVKTGHCVNDTPANRKKLGIAPKPKGAPAPPTPTIAPEPTPEPEPEPKCPAGKLFNPETDRCINDTPANRKKLGIEAPKPAKAAPSPSPSPKGNGNGWMDHVRAHYDARRKEDPDYKWTDAMKDAKETYNANPLVNTRSKVGIGGRKR